MMVTMTEKTLGGKGRNLSKLQEFGYAVPRWFVIPGECMQQATENLDFATLTDLSDPARAAQDIRQAISTLSIPDEEWILENYRGFGKVAVRSSADLEDGAVHSFAGQLDTFLGIEGIPSLLEAIKGCWASAYSERALVYRAKHGLPLTGMKVAVIVQEMIEGQVSGVMFTADPVTGDREHLVISATWGLGEGLVSGQLDADTFTVSRHHDTIDSTVVLKQQRVELSQDGKTQLVEVPKNQQNKECLTIEQLRLLTKVGADIESAFGCPQDIEFTIADKLYLLQARPITALPAPKAQGKARFYDNSNIIESYSGVTTPLTFSFASRLYEALYRQMAESMGFSEATVQRCDILFKNMLGLIEGRIYYNLGNWYALLGNFSGAPALRGFFKQSIGTTQDGDAAQEKGSKLEIIKLAFTLLGHLSRWDRNIRRFQQEFQVVYEKMRLTDYPTMGLEELIETYLSLEKQLIQAWKAPMLNEFFAMSFYGLLRQAIEKLGLEGLQNELISSEGDIESTRPAECLLQLAKTAQSEEGLAEKLLATPPEEAIILLEDHPNFARLFQSYLWNYGDRGMGELKLETLTPRENPKFLFEILQNYLKMPDLASAKVEHQSLRHIAEKRLAKALKGRPFYAHYVNFVLAGARKGIKTRENMRLARTRAFGIVRSIVLEVGRKLASRQLLGDPRDVFYLTLEELIAWVQGRSTCTNLKDLARLRKAEFAVHHQKPNPADRFETFGPVYLDNNYAQEAVDESSSGTLKGLSGCPGKVSGLARVVTREDIRLSGEILVAERTDPGWIPLYPSASGLLIERGSMLSHSVIVARELGLPTIVGIPNLTRRVKDGQYLEMDAKQGIVKLKEQA